MAEHKIEIKVWNIECIRETVHGYMLILLIGRPDKEMRKELQETYHKHREIYVPKVKLVLLSKWSILITNEIWSCYLDGI